jgi:uncharacterized protein DUF5916
MPMRFCLIVTLIAWASFAAPAAAATSASGAYVAARAPHSLALDPSLKDPAWQAGRLPDAGGFENLTRRSPAAHGTTTYLLYDDKNLYVGFDVEQTGAPTVAEQTTNDVGFGLDDFVGIGVDTSGNGTQMYYFEVTPRGVRFQQANETARYRPTWQAAAAGTPDGHWHAVMIIPLNVLRIHAGASQAWRINVIRSLAGVGEHYTWAYDGIMQDGGAGNWPNFIDVRFWPTWTSIALRGVASVRPHPHLELYGLESMGTDRSQFAQADGSFQHQNARVAGLDFTYPITNTINFVGTLNPDFSNVEIDQQTIAPQEFRRNLQEYRPFFAQGANFINTSAVQIGPNVNFYSPSVGPFDRGAKIEGTFGKQAFGVLSFKGFNQLTGDTFDDVAYGYKHALPDRTFLYWADGVFAHHSMAGTDTTAEFGIAGRNLKNGFVWGGQHAFERGTWVPNGIAHSSIGFVDVHKPNYEVLLGYQDITPTFNPLDGFTAAADERGTFAFANLNGSARGVKNFSINPFVDRYFDRSGAVHQADFDLGINATFTNGFSLNGLGPNIGELRGYEIPANPDCTGATVGFTYFSGYPCYRNGRTDVFNLFFLPIGYRDGTPTPIDVTYGWGNFGPWYLHQINTSTSRSLGKTLSLSLEYDGTYERNRGTGILESQWLRRVSLGVNLGPESNLTFSLRSINGVGGFAPKQGTNFAAAFHRRFPGGNELFINYGTPAAFTTLNRLIIKYLFRLGGGAGT